MAKKLLNVLLLTIGLSTSAHSFSATIFSDNFDTEAGSNALAYNSFIN